MSSDWQPIPPPQKTYKQKRENEHSQVADFIYQFGESKILTQKSQPVDLKDIQSETIQKQIKYLKECLLKYREITGLGRGVAAPQIGLPLQMAVIYTKEELITIINPKILKSSKELLCYPEICMSTATIITPVIRPSFIEFEYLDEKGTKQLWNQKADTEQSKILNRVFEHEIDHLFGTLALSKVSKINEISLDVNPDFFKKAKFREVNND